jgi:putative transposon-encoded protein
VVAMRKIDLIGTKFSLEDEVEAMFEGEVKKIGNGGMILSNKKYIGRKVYVLIRK